MAGNNSRNDNTAVGYCNPPKSGRFRSGESGNSGGRQKGSRNRKTILREIAEEERIVTIDGTKQPIRTLDLLFLQLRNLALAGDEKALEAFNDWNAKFCEEAEAKLTVGLWIGEGTYGPEDTILTVERIKESST